MWLGMNTRHIHIKSSMHHLNLSLEKMENICLIGKHFVIDGNSRYVLLLVKFINVFRIFGRYLSILSFTSITPDMIIEIKLLVNFALLLNYDELNTVKSSRLNFPNCYSQSCRFAYMRPIIFFRNNWFCNPLWCNKLQNPVAI